MSTYKITNPPPIADVSSERSDGGWVIGRNGMLALLSVFVLSFLVAWARVAARQPLWMDEILAVWTARMPTFHEVFLAPFQGSDFSPPVFHFILHAVIHTLGGSYLFLRLPSVIGALTASASIFILLRRYAGTPTAAFGSVVCLMGILTSYASEARPYALVVACFAISAVLWDQLDGGRSDVLRVCGIALLLALATALHFYAVLLIPCLALIELLHWAISRSLRVPVWIGLIAAGASSLLFLPLIRAISKFNTGDTGSIAYYAKPTIPRLMSTYSDLFLFGKRPVRLILALICIAVLIYALDRTGLVSRLPRFTSLETLRPEMTNLYLIALGTAVFPLLVFIFSKVVTKTFNPRYCVTGCIGISIITALVLAKLPRFNVIIAPLLLAASFIMIIPGSELTLGVPTFAPGFLSKLKEPYPIVVAEGLQYFQFYEQASADLRRKLFYVRDPEGVVSADPTNNNQLARWLPLRPELNVVQAKRFFAQHRHFYLVVTPTSTNVLTDWLLEKNLLGKPVTREDDAWVYDAESPNGSD